MSQELLTKTLNERGSVYGTYTTTARQAVTYFNRLNKQGLQSHEVHTMFMISTKLARITQGNDKKHMDSWLDIAGYCKLSVDASIKEPDFKPLTFVKNQDIDYYILFMEKLIYMFKNDEISNVNFYKNITVLIDHVLTEIL